MKLKNQQPTPVLTPSLEALHAAIEVLDVKMVQRIIESNDFKGISAWRIGQYLAHIVRKMTFNTRALDVNVHLFGDNFARGFAITQLLLARANERIDSCLEEEFKHMKSLIEMIRTQDSTTESLQREIALLVALHNSLGTEFDNNKKAGSLYLLELQIQFQIKFLAAHFKYNPKATLELISTIANQVTHKQRFNQVATWIATMDKKCTDYAAAVLAKNSKSVASSADDYYLNMLIADKETGEVHSPLYWAFKNKDKKTQNFLLSAQAYLPFLYPDWLLLNEVTSKFVNQRVIAEYEQPKSKRYTSHCSNWRNSCSVRLFSLFAAHSPHLLAVVDTNKAQDFNIEKDRLSRKNLIGIIVDIIQSPRIQNKHQLIAAILQKSQVHFISSIPYSLHPIERLREQQQYESYDADRPFKYEIKETEDYVSIEEFKLFHLYTILFEDIDDAENIYRDEATKNTMRRNKEHYFWLLKLLSDDLVLALLMKYQNQYGLGIWDEVYHRVIRLKNEQLYFHLRQNIKEDEITTNFNKVSGLSKNTVPYFFTLSRKNRETKLYQLPTGIIDKIGYFVDPKIKRTPKLMQTKDFTGSYKTLPIHSAIISADTDAVKQAICTDITNIDSYNDEGLTPLMVCLNAIFENRKQEWSSRFDDDQRTAITQKDQNLYAIFKHLVKSDAKLDTVCPIKLAESTVMMTALHYALMRHMVDIAKLLLEFGASAHLLDSNGWLPIAYCHYNDSQYRTNFYYDELFPVIQILMQKQPRLNQKTCEVLSQRAHGLINYNPDPAIEGVAEFTQAYVRLITSKHQEIVDAEDYSKFIEASREAFAQAVLQLDLKLMQKIHHQVLQRNQEISQNDNEHIHIDSISSSLGHFVEVNTAESSNLESYNYLSYAILNKRFDILYWLIESGRSLKQNEDCLFVNAKMEIPEGEKQKLAQIYLAEWLRSNAYHRRSNLRLISVYSIFYQLVPLLFSTPPMVASDEDSNSEDSPNPTSQSTKGVDFLKSTLLSLIRVHRFADEEVLKRMAFILDLEPSLHLYLQNHCEQQLQDEKSTPEEVIIRLKLVLNHLDLIRPRTALTSHSGC